MFCVVVAMYRLCTGWLLHKSPQEEAKWVEDRAVSSNLAKAS